MSSLQEMGTYTHTHVHDDDDDQCTDHPITADLEHNRLESLPQSIGGMLSLSLLVLNELRSLPLLLLL